MVIQKFNRLIRNKWVWGIFAILISVFFAFDFLFYEDRSNDKAMNGVGTLAGEDVDAMAFQNEVQNIRGIGRQRDWETPVHEVNKTAWENLAAAKVAKDYNLASNDSDLQNEIYMSCMRWRILGQQGQFDYGRYESFLRDALGVKPLEFENYLRRVITASKAMNVVPMSARWVAPLELESAVNDQTDKFSIRIAAYTDKDVKVKPLDEAALKNYYNENTNSLALPDLVSVRYIKIKADDAARLAKISVSSNEVFDLYDSVSAERYTTDTTNGPVTKAVGEVYAELEKELKIINSIEIIKTNILFRAYPVDSDNVVKAKDDIFKKIAKEEKLEIKTSPLFSVAGGKVVKGFMVSPSSIAPGCKDFTEKVAEIDPENVDTRYNIATSEKEVYFFEIAKTVKAHIPTFAEAKEIIRPDAVKAAKQKAFKDFVNSKRAIAAKLVATGKALDAKAIGADNVSTSMTFTVQSRPSFPDSMDVLKAVARLDKGQVSEFVSTANRHRGLLVYVENREAGDDGKSALIRSGIQSELGSYYGRSLGGKWREWNLNDMGFVTTASSSVTPEESAEVSE
ncbi:MAG: SurA N-terminal domain-containing protein [Kiritimatiellae bacterium]|nr:SurA N-terminal domain-containing protein [Kiritimatiellia bacterium]